MKKQICLIGITAVLLITGCGYHTENGEERIVLQTPAAETNVGTEEEVCEEVTLPRVPEELKKMEEGSKEWQAAMEEYCEEAAPFWKQIVDRAPLKWGEKIPNLGPHEMLAARTMWSYLDQKGMTSSLYTLNAFHLLELGGSGRVTDSEYLPHIGTDEIEKEKIEGYHVKIHGIFANGGEGEMYYTLKDEEGRIVWEYTQGPGCEQLFFDVELEGGTYVFCADVKSGSPYPSYATYEYYRFTDEENEKAMKEYAQFQGGE